jgi:hypothetical protein
MFANDHVPILLIGLHAGKDLSAEGAFLEELPVLLLGVVESHMLPATEGGFCPLLMKSVVDRDVVSTRRSDQFLDMLDGAPLIDVREAGSELAIGMKEVVVRVDQNYSGLGQRGRHFGWYIWSSSGCLLVAILYEIFAQSKPLYTSCSAADYQSRSSFLVMPLVSTVLPLAHGTRTRLVDISCCR